MKSFTDINQSKKLAEILPVESADAFYDMAEPGKRQVPIIGHSNEYYDMEDWAIPCWSLAALLDIFPCSKKSPIINLTRGGWNPSFTRRWFATWEDEDKNVFYSSDGITSIDAVVELILKLHEQKLL